MFDHKGSVMNIFSLGCTFEEKFLNHCYGKNPTKFNEGGWIILSQVGGSMKLKRAQLLQHQQLQQRQLQQQQQQKSKKPINLFSPTHWSKEHRNGWQWRSWSRSWLLLLGGWGGEGGIPPPWGKSIRQGIKLLSSSMNNKWWLGKFSRERDFNSIFKNRRFMIFDIGKILNRVRFNWSR